MQDTSGYSALHHAAVNGHRYVSRNEINCNVSPSSCRGSSPPPPPPVPSVGTSLIVRNAHSVGFTRACRDVVRLLLQYEASTNVVDAKGSSPLHLAAWAGHGDIVRLILSQGPSVPKVNLVVSEHRSLSPCRCCRQSVYRLGPRAHIPRQSRGGASGSACIPRGNSLAILGEHSRRAGSCIAVCESPRWRFAGGSSISVTRLGRKKKTKQP